MLHTKPRVRMKTTWQHCYTTLRPYADDVAGNVHRLQIKDYQKSHEISLYNSCNSILACISLFFKEEKQQRALIRSNVCEQRRFSKHILWFYLHFLTSPPILFANLLPTLTNAGRFCNFNMTPNKCYGVFMFIYF